MEKYPSQTQDKFTVRFPEGMRDLIAEMAKNDGRSMNSEIVALLELAIKVCKNFGPEDGPVVQQFQKRLKELNEKSNKIEESIALTKSEMDQMVKRITDALMTQITHNFDLIPKKPQKSDDSHSKGSNKKPT